MEGSGSRREYLSTALNPPGGQPVESFIADVAEEEECSTLVLYLPGVGRTSIMFIYTGCKYIYLVQVGLVQRSTLVQAGQEGCFENWFYVYLALVGPFECSTLFLHLPGAIRISRKVPPGSTLR